MQVHTTEALSSPERLLDVPEQGPVASADTVSELCRLRINVMRRLAPDVVASRHWHSRI
jgi:hypothetical protein